MGFGLHVVGSVWVNGEPIISRFESLSVHYTQIGVRKAILRPLVDSSFSLGRAVNIRFRRMASKAEYYEMHTASIF